MGSNRERNLEMRTVQNIVIPVHEKVTVDSVDTNKNEGNSESFQEKLKISAHIDFEKKNLELENILLYGAVDQYLFEHKEEIRDYDSISSQEDKTNFFLSLMLKQSEDIIKTNSDDMFVFDI